MIIDALGAGPLPFAALRRAVPGISDAVLSDRLSEARRGGAVEPRGDAGPARRGDLRPDDKATGLLPILQQLGGWAHANLAGPADR